MAQNIVTAAMLAIGDELLSGKTKDKNIAHIAELFTVIGIDLEEVRIVPDTENAIVKAVNELRNEYDYVFTSGGIGPTHDDITADAISMAFNLPCEYDEEALALLDKTYADRDLEFTPARKRMARMPKGAKHIKNRVSIAPGFIVENVYVMAGVPAIFQAMLDELLPNLKTGNKMHSQAILCSFGEGDIAIPLGEIQKEFSAVSIGSYPKFDGKKFSTELVLRARSIEELSNAAAKVQSLVDTINAKRA